MYAEVVVSATVRPRVISNQGLSQEGGTINGYSPLGTTFHYSVPPHLEDEVAVGQLVLVPFRTGQRQGVIMDLSQTSPVAETRDVEAIVKPELVLLPHQIELARWISDYYLAPLNRAVRLMLPPGIERKPEPFIELKAGAHIPAGLRGEPRAIIDLLRHEGPLRARQLEQHLGGNWRPLIDGLVRRGLVVKTSKLREPRVRPKRDRLVRLVADEERIAEEIPRLGHSSKQADVLAFLAESDDPLPTLAEVCARLGYTAAPVRSLAEKDLVGITERRELIVPLLPTHVLNEAIAGDLRRAPRQAAVLAYLRDRPDSVEVTELYRQTGASRAVLRALEAKGYVQCLRQEPAVLLNIPPEEVVDRIIELRGAEKQMAVLDLLQSEEEEAVWIGWVYAETGCTLDTLRDLVAHGLVSLEEEGVWRDPLAGREFRPEAPPRLTSHQEAVLGDISQGLVGGKPAVYLLHGVTGSGKTEIYLRALEVALAQGRGAIVLVPEIALTPQTIRRFAARFPGRIAILHSKLSLGERYDGWQRIREGEVDIVIGSRSAVFAPLARPGLIIVDEEHEWSYKQERTPCYHARDVAVKLAELTGATVVLGSATPGIVSYYRAQQGRYRLLELPQRILWNKARLEEQKAQYRIPDTRHWMREAGILYSDLPPVRVIDLRQELKAGNRSIFSRALRRAMTEALTAKQQVILFLNRRGTATFVMCRDCGLVLKCPRCDVPLTYHTTGGERGEVRLVCHHCNRHTGVPGQCPHCFSSRIRFFGVGTQKVEAVTRELFPEARLQRWDRDVTGSKGAHEALLERFITHEADILIGTQMIAKGLDLPLVTLVGVISADTALYLPDFRASERTFQLLTQVAGRAGRSILGGQVIIQTYTPHHYCIQAASHHDYIGFYEQELAFRREHGYPPFSRLARLIYVHPNGERCRQEAEKLQRLLRDKIARLGLPGVALIGPAPCFLSRLRAKHRWQIVVRAPDPRALLGDLALPLGWRVDIDPVNML